MVDTSPTTPVTQNETQKEKENISNNRIKGTLFISAKEMLNQNSDQIEESEPRDGDEEDDITSVGSEQSEDTEKGMKIDEKNKPYIDVIMYAIKTYPPCIKAYTVSLQNKYLAEVNKQQAIIKASDKLNKLKKKSATSATKQALLKEKSVTPKILGTLIQEKVSAEIGKQNRGVEQVLKRRNELGKEIQKKK